MVIDHERALALAFAPFDVEVERGRLRAFAAAVGETDPVHFDLDEARATGHPDVLAMPKFLFSLELEAADPFGYLDQVGADLRGILHGEQRFAYHSPLFARETVTVRSRISGAYAKNERMDFLVKHTEFLRGEELIGDADSLIVARAVTVR